MNGYTLQSYCPKQTLEEVLKAALSPVPPIWLLFTVFRLCLGNCFSCPKLIPKLPFLTCCDVSFTHSSAQSQQLALYLLNDALWRLFLGRARPLNAAIFLLSFCRQIFRCSYLLPLHLPAVSLFNSGYHGVHQLQSCHRHRTIKRKKQCKRARDPN